MNLVVLGANGRTGQHVVRIALAEGMFVTAVVRRPDRTVSIAHERLDVVVGDPCDPAFLERIFEGKDAVISTLGGRRPTQRATSVYYGSARAIVEAARRSGLERALVTSTALLFEAQPCLGKLLRRLVPNVVSSAACMEATFKASDLDWTVVRPGFLTDGNEETSHTRKGAAPADGTSISRRALARVLIDALKTPETVGHVLGVSSGKGVAQPN